MQPIDSTFSLPPFPAFPSVARYVPLGTIENAMQRVCRSIDAREGLALVIGPPGTGKSLICSLLVDRYSASHDVVVLGETPIKNSAAFQRHLLHHLGADFESISDDDLQLALVNRICDSDSPDGGLVMVIDEAQSLSPEVIESIRMVTNIMRDGQPRVFAVLCGGVKLEETLVSPSLEAFTQRIATRCYLHAMNSEETGNYIRETILACGAETENTITSEATAAVHHACSGVPRLVNQIMTEAIDCAEEAGQELIDEQTIDRAWAQLQQLPSPMVEEPRIAGEGSAVEFGELDEFDPQPENGFPESTSPESTSPESTLTESTLTESTLTETTLTETTPRPEWDSPTEISVPAGEPTGQVLAEQTAGCDSGGCQSGDCQSGDCQSTAGTVIDDQPGDKSTADIVVPQIIAEQDSECCESMNFDDDIRIDSSSVEFELESEMKVGPRVGQQPVVPSQQRTESAPLFGDFEDEEVVAIGSGCIAPVTRLVDEPPADLESMLHQEIIGISAVAAIGLELYSESAPEILPIDDQGTEIVREPEEVVEDFVTEPIDGEPEPRESPEVLESSDPSNSPNAPDSRDASDSPETSDSPDASCSPNSGEDLLQLNDPEASSVPKDDSDLLVVEDDVNITSRSPVKRLDSHEQTISVDFQSMLARMRSGA